MLHFPGGSTPRAPRASRTLSSKSTRSVAALLAVPLLAVSAAACGDGGSDGKPPSVSGSWGRTPKIDKGEGDPPSALKTKVLRSGKGQKVRKGDVISAYYVGQLWNGKEFDSSWKRKAPDTFQIGTGKVIKGWDEALVGRKLGSRVEIVAPPDKAYGEKGRPPSIPGNSTLVFVVDLKKITPGAIDGKPVDKPQNPELPKVSTTVRKDKAPSVRMPKGREEGPDRLVSETIIKGDGKKAVDEKSTILAHFTAKSWKGGQQLDDTWAQGGAPQRIPVARIAGWKEGLKGATAGSRVVISVPESSFPKQQRKQVEGGVVFSVDIVEVE
ncbi:FKBP-type peptidyl-prolyl cis-trans isomerase [Streptomyces albus subsp. chlorinus]|uniref:FKBP-type peptidyl-prolyl cis-trans isomerase n=1 Tax=Streptomyces albus TaxID=1888 RepID=UPI00156F579B|nr:FKBP-type peptidyl-prolyl cis-trans isomerase [Streptomyces albus]NSC20713.1 FKBP-type peptidyl-prolyl cis-trans isomerase [Streptomyces albus subsp. chlorinus]